MLHFIIQKMYLTLIIFILQQLIQIVILQDILLQQQKRQMIYYLIQQMFIVLVEVLVQKVGTVVNYKYKPQAFQPQLVMILEILKFLFHILIAYNLNISQVIIILFGQFLMGILDLHQLKLLMALKKLQVWFLLEAELRVQLQEQIELHL